MSSNSQQLIVSHLERGRALEVREHWSSPAERCRWRDSWRLRRAPRPEHSSASCTHSRSDVYNQCCLSPRPNIPPFSVKPSSKSSQFILRYEHYLLFRIPSDEAIDLNRGFRFVCVQHISVRLFHCNCFITVSKKTGPLRLIWHSFTNSHYLLIVFGTERPHLIPNSTG